MPYIYIKKTFVIFLLSILCLIPFNIVSAEQKEEILAEKKLNFMEILEFTFNNNDNLNAEREKTKAIQTLKFKTLGKNALPNIGIDLNYGYTDFKENMGNDTMKFIIDTEGELMNNSIYLNQPIFKSGRTLTQMKAVKNQISSGARNFL